VQKEPKDIYPDELLDSQKKARYFLYLKVGNMQDILDMTPWDFWGVCEAAAEQNKKPAHRELKQSQKDMIERTKHGD